MRPVNAGPVNHKPRIAFMGVSVGLPAEQGEGQGMPMLIALLARLAVDFDLAVYSLIRANKEKLPKGMKLRQITTLKIPMYIKYLFLIITFVFDHLRKPFDMINAISAFPAGRIAVILGAIIRRPVIVHLIGSETVMMPEIGYGDLLVPRLRKISSWVCRKADVLIVQSEYQKKITEKNLRLDRETSVLSRRVEVGKFPYRERVITFPVNFLHIASYQPVKDQETLFSAFAKIAKQVDSRLTVVGHGFDVPGVKQMLIDLGIETKVKLTGEVKHEEMAGHFAKAHILLHTSRYESLCGVVQEAMASGVPVCGTEVGILADLGDPFAVVVPPHNPDELANRTLSLIHDADRYNRQQKLAREYIVNHDADWAAKKYKDLFEKWLK